MDFYEYYEGLQEGWDGPALLVFSDGIKTGARLDRNGLRPARYWTTEDGMVYVASEVSLCCLHIETCVLLGCHSTLTTVFQCVWPTVLVLPVCHYYESPRPDFHCMKLDVYCCLAVCPFRHQA